MRKFIVMALLLCVGAISGGSVFAAAGFSATAGIVLGIAGSFLPGIPSGTLGAGLHTEVWTGFMVKKLRADQDAPWLDGITDFSDQVDNDVIHAVDIGIDPDVLINTNTYPIPYQELEDGDLTFQLDRYDTKNTPVKEETLYAISYDKMASVIERHKKSITSNKFRKAIHSYAPLKNEAKTPVIATTGAASDGRKQLVPKDILALKKKFDDMEVPEQGRRLVLCPDHLNDLLALDQKFKDQYYSWTTGKIANVYGFEVYSFVGNPYYSSAGVKKAYGSAIATGDNKATVAFYTGRVMKADGSTIPFLRHFKDDPDYRRNTVGFRHRAIHLPLKQEALGAIYSAVV